MCQSKNYDSNYGQCFRGIRRFHRSDGGGGNFLCPGERSKRRALRRVICSPAPSITRLQELMDGRRQWGKNN